MLFLEKVSSYITFLIKDENIMTKISFFGFDKNLVKFFIELMHFKFYL